MIRDIQPLVQVTKDKVLLIRRQHACRIASHRISAQRDYCYEQGRATTAKLTGRHKKIELLLPWTATSWPRCYATIPRPKPSSLLWYPSAGRSSCSWPASRATHATRAAGSIRWGDAAATTEAPGGARLRGCRCLPVPAARAQEARRQTASTSRGGSDATGRTGGIAGSGAGGSATRPWATSRTSAAGDGTRIGLVIAS